MSVGRVALDVLVAHPVAPWAKRRDLTYFDLTLFETVASYNFRNRSSFFLKWQPQISLRLLSRFLNL